MKIKAYIEDGNYESFCFLIGTQLKGDLYMLYLTLVNTQKDELNISKWFKCKNEVTEENTIKMVNAKHGQNMSQKKRAEDQGNHVKTSLPKSAQLNLNESQCRISRSLQSLD